MHRHEIPYPIWIIFGSTVGIPDVITYANLGDDRLRVLGVVGSNYHSDRLSSSSLQHYRTTVRVCDLQPGLKLAFLNRAQTRVLQQAAVNDWHDDKSVYEDCSFCYFTHMKDTNILTKTQKANGIIMAYTFCN